MGKLTRKKALANLAAEIERLPDGDPRKADLLSRYVRLTPVRPRRTTRIGEVRATVLREQQEANCSKWWMSLGDDERRFWRGLWAIEYLSDPPGCVVSRATGHCEPLTDAEIEKARAYLESLPKDNWQYLAYIERQKKCPPPAAPQIQPGTHPRWPALLTSALPKDN